jgi:hypothetical protein
LIKCVVKKDVFLPLYFHPWEFTDYHKANGNAKYLFYLRRSNDDKMLKRSKKLMKFLDKQGFEFEISGGFLKYKFVK